MRRYALLTTLLIGTLAVTAQEPTSGVAVPNTFRTYVVVDQRFEIKKGTDTQGTPEADPRDRTEKLHCFVCEHKLNPTVAVLTRTAPNAESPVANLTKSLQGIIAENRATRLNAFVVFLSLETEFPGDNTRNDKGEFQRDVKASEVKALYDALKTNLVPLTIAAKKSDSLTAWGMADDQETVVVLYNNLRVVKKWPFGADGPTADDIKAILTATKSAIGK